MNVRKVFFVSSKAMSCLSVHAFRALKKIEFFEQNKNIFGNCIAKVLRAESGQTGNMSFFSLGFLFNNTLRPDRASSLGVGIFGKGKASKDIWSVIIVTYCFRLLGIPFIFHNFHSSWDFSSYFLTGLWWPLRCPFRTTYITWQVFLNRW